jgi:putative FmdB family regulatory protein
VVNPDYECQKCGHIEEIAHLMNHVPSHEHCSVCGGTSDKLFSAPAFTCKGDDLDPGGKPVYCPSLATYQRKGKQDPKAWFTSKSKARDAAKKKADSADGYELHLDS